MLTLLLSAFIFQTPAQMATPKAAIVESGKFRLHKFEQSIGEETYEITRDGNSLTVKSNFKFTDRGSPVSLTATLRTKQNLTPEWFEIKGNTARGSTIDTSIEIKGNTAAIREGKETGQANVPAKFFTIAGYAPTAIQQMLMRYLARNKIKGSLQTLPDGEVTVEKRGSDRIKIGDKTVALDRYSVSGLIWGRESLWLDSKQNLVALVSVDAEFDHFEALREEYESALAIFVGKAAEDGDVPFAQFEPGAAKLPRELYAPINNTGLPPERAAFGRDRMKMFLDVTGALHRAGLNIVAGTDQVVPGHSLRREIELYVQAGFNITRHKPTQPTIEFAKQQGQFKPENFSPFDRLQNVTVQEILDGVKMNVQRGWLVSAAIRRI